jgi:hypothetical protein
MKSTNLTSNVIKQKRQLETTFYGNFSKRSNMDNDNDFFGLPSKVKHMFKKHKKITQLYGMYMIIWNLMCLIK